LTGQETKMPILSVKDGEIVTTSRDVSEFFERKHDDVLKSVRALHCSPEFRLGNFTEFKINDLTGDKVSHYEMTKDGFTFLVMGWTGKRAGQFKEAYIARFNAMEAALRGGLQTTRPVVPDSAEMEFVRLAKQVKGERFASALWDSLGFYAPPGYEPKKQGSLFDAAANTNFLTHAA